ncbi:nucleotidyltransferase domain-containing protein [bacterium]|nr:nucleotidyltransferase domain-containing protein [FCB group bacterium]MBL7191009.1 nucleotidyltransferase domain-containing protein [bacterium]
MDKTEILNIIVRFKDALIKNGLRVENIILYGSYHTGGFREDSDIDLIVISEDFKGKGFLERIDMMMEALCEVFKPIEAYPMTPEEYKKGDSMIALFAREGEEVG